MLACLKMSDPVGLTMAGKIDVLLLLGKGEKSPFKRGLDFPLFSCT